MAISEFEIFKVEKSAKQFCDNRNKNYPPDKLYIDYRLEGQSLFLLEVRPVWNDPSRKTEMDVAKITFIKKESLWKLYRQRQNMKWQLYDPKSNSKDLEVLLKEIWDDPMGCFWG